jgi:hypothetical protein
VKARAYDVGTAGRGARGSGRAIGVRAALLLLGAACGRAGGPLPPPDAPQLVDEADPVRARVTIAKRASAPMTVDWQPESRTDLEVIKRQGPAVVRFDPRSFELLPDCHGEGAYSYVGVTPKEQNITLRSKAELHTNLPFGAVALEGTLSKAGALSVMMRMVGKEVLDRPAVRRDELRGRCAGATHYVQSMTLGAFRFAAGAAGGGGLGATAFGAGARGEASSSRDTLQTDGDFASCEGADPAAARAPARCGAVLRIEIVPLDVEGGAPAAGAGAAACGEGTRWNGEACVTLAHLRAEAASAPAARADAEPAGRGAGFECDPREAGECVEQCRLGNLASCTAVGHHLRAGASGLPPDEARADRLWAAACKRGHAPACTALAGAFAARRQWAEALALGRAACQGGDPAGCNAVAVQSFFGRGTREDRAGAYALWARACALRDYASCSNAGVVVRHGMGGVARDVARARRLFALACSSPAKAGCTNLGELEELGVGGPADPAAAMRLYLEGCERGQAGGCVLAGLLAEERGRQRPKALALFERGCDVGDDGGGCLSEAEMRGYYAGVYGDESMHRRSCDGASQAALACYNAGLGHERGYRSGAADLGRAGAFLRKACDAGLQKACRSPRPGLATADRSTAEGGLVTH